MRTLLVAPKTDLEYSDEEVTQVVNLLSPMLLHGNVTSEDVLEAVQDGSWDIVWFATHGDEYGIFLTDGPLDPSMLTPLLRLSDAKLVYLNTCHSLPIALAIQNEFLTDFICTVQEVPDKVAYFTGRQFAFHISRGANFFESYAGARPGRNDKFVYLAGRAREVNGSSEAIELIERELENIRKHIYGDPATNYDGMVRSVKNNRREINAMRWIMVSIAIILVFIMILLAAVIFRI